jgi:glyoxylase-like metal-dependent hydrolase (beta-lactamase superfamily II)
MAEVSILVTGYADLAHGLVGPTISLVRDHDHCLIIDPGSVSDPQVISLALARHHLKWEDIDAVGISHAHLDHYRFIGLFPRAVCLDAWGSWQANHFYAGPTERIYRPDIQILATPGHSHDSITFLVQTHLGRVAICGDLFWDESGPADDPYAEDIPLLRQNREKIRTMADWIVPGHGPMFRVS